MKILQTENTVSYTFAVVHSQTEQDAGNKL
jgi:hypothetical protein